MRKIGIIFILAIFLVLLAGCLNMEISTKVNKDFSGTRSVYLEINKAFWDLMPPSSKESYKNDLKRSLGGDIISYDEKVEGTWVVIKAESRVNDLRQVPNVTISKVDNKIRFEEKYKPTSTPTPTPTPTRTPTPIPTPYQKTVSDWRALYQGQSWYLDGGYSLYVYTIGTVATRLQIKKDSNVLLEKSVSQGESLSFDKYTFRVDNVWGSLGEIMVTKYEVVTVTPTPTFEWTWTPTPSTSSQWGESMGGIFRVTYKVEMPAKITSSNADNVTENIATWYFNASSREKTMVVESEIPAMPEFTLILSLIAISALVIYLMKTKK